MFGIDRAALGGEMENSFRLISALSHQFVGKIDKNKRSSHIKI